MPGPRQRRSRRKRNKERNGGGWLTDHEACRPVKTSEQSPEAAPPASALPPIDATKLSDEDYRRYLAARGLQLPVDALNEHCNRPRDAQPLDPKFIAQVKANKRAEALQRAKELEQGKIDARTAPREQVISRMKQYAGDDAVFFEGIREPGRPGSMDLNPELFDRYTSRPTAEYYKKLEADRAAEQERVNKATPGYGYYRDKMAAAALRAGGQQTRRPRVRSPNQGKPPPPEPKKKVDARGMSPAEWAAYLATRELSQPTP